MRVGIDVASVNRFKSPLKKENFLKKNFSIIEIEYILKKTKKEETLAGLFAAKEAFLKALEVGIYNGILMSDIEILHKENGAPYVNVSKDLKQKYNIKEIAISIAHDGKTATAVCIIS